jgi:hypothetical protein
MLAMTLATCSADNGGDTPTPPPPGQLTLDQRLVGGKWYYFVYDHGYGDLRITGYSTDFNSYYYFPNNYTLQASRTLLSEIFGGGNIFNDHAYSKDGIIYQKSDNPAVNGRKLMEYQFHTTWPFPNNSSIPYYYDISNDMRTELTNLAIENIIITYRLYNMNGTLYDDGRKLFEWVLIRTAEDD